MSFDNHSYVITTKIIEKFMRLIFLKLKKITIGKKDSVKESE